MNDENSRTKIPNVPGDSSGLSSSILTALEFDTGEMAWRNRSVGKGSVIYADERLYLYGENGTVGLAEATGYGERGRFSVAPSTSNPSWSHPIITNGKLIVRDQDNIFAYLIRPG